MKSTSLPVETVLESQETRDEKIKELIVKAQRSTTTPEEYQQLEDEFIRVVRAG